MPKIRKPSFQALFFALVAAAFAAPQFLLSSPYAYSGLGHYSGLSAYSNLAYSSPLALQAPAVAYSAPAPYAYQTAPVVSYAAEPVEQHGYK